MTKSKPFGELAARVKADPVRRARIAVEKQAIEGALSLAEFRSQQKVTQQTVANTLGVTQANISRIEHEEDLYLSTLRGYLAALGADLELNAVFPDGRFALGAHEVWRGAADEATIPAPFAMATAAPTPSLVEAHLRADRNLTPHTAALLARMFRAAYVEFAEHGSDQESSEDHAPQTNEAGN